MPPLTLDDILAAGEETEEEKRRALTQPADAPAAVAPPAQAIVPTDADFAPRDNPILISPRGPQDYGLGTEAYFARARAKKAEAEARAKALGTAGPAMEAAGLGARPVVIQPHYITEAERTAGTPKGLAAAGLTYYPAFVKGGTSLITDPAAYAARLAGAKDIADTISSENLTPTMPGAEAEGLVHGLGFLGSLGATVATAGLGAGASAATKVPTVLSRVGQAAGKVGVPLAFGGQTAEQTYQIAKKAGADEQQAMTAGNIAGVAGTAGGFLTGRAVGNAAGAITPGFVKSAAGKAAPPVARTIAEEAFKEGAAGAAQNVLTTAGQNVGLRTSGAIPDQPLTQGLGTSALVGGLVGGALGGGTTALRLRGRSLTPESTTMSGEKGVDPITGTTGHIADSLSKLPHFADMTPEQMGAEIDAMAEALHMEPPVPAMRDAIIAQAHSMKAPTVAEIRPGEVPAEFNRYVLEDKDGPRTAQEAADRFKDNTQYGKDMTPEQWRQHIGTALRGTPEGDLAEQVFSEIRPTYPTIDTQGHADNVRAAIRDLKSLNALPLGKSAAGEWILPDGFEGNKEAGESLSRFKTAVENAGKPRVGVPIPKATDIAEAAATKAEAVNQIADADALLGGLKEMGFRAVTPQMEKNLRNAFTMGGTRSSVSVEVGTDANGNRTFTVSGDSAPQRKRAADLLKAVVEHYGKDQPPTVVVEKKVEGKPSVENVKRAVVGFKPIPGTEKVPVPKTEGAGEGAPITPSQPEVPKPVAETTTPPSPSAKPNVVRGYHGTRQSFSEFGAPAYRKGEQLSFGYHFYAEKEPAARYANEPDVARKGKNPNVVEADLDLGNNLDARRIVREGDPEWPLVEKLVGPKYVFMRDDGRKAIWLQNAIDAAAPKKAEQVLREHGYDSVSYDASVGRRVPGGISGKQTHPAFVVLDKAKIRTTPPSPAAKEPWQMTRKEFGDQEAARGKKTSDAAEATVNFRVGDFKSGIVIGNERVVRSKDSVFTVPPPPSLVGKKPGLSVGLVETSGDKGQRILLFAHGNGKSLPLDEIAPEGTYGFRDPIGGVTIRNGMAESIWVSDAWRGSPAFKTLMSELEAKGIRFDPDSPQSADFLRATSKKAHRDAVESAIKAGLAVPEKVRAEYGATPPSPASRGALLEKPLPYADRAKSLTRLRGETLQMVGGAYNPHFNVIGAEGGHYDPKRADLAVVETVPSDGRTAAVVRNGRNVEIQIHPNAARMVNEGHEEVASIAREIMTGMYPKAVALTQKELGGTIKFDASMSEPVVEGSGLLKQVVDNIWASRLRDAYVDAKGNEVPADYQGAVPGKVVDPRLEAGARREIEQMMASDNERFDKAVKVMARGGLLTKGGAVSRALATAAEFAKRLTNKFRGDGFLIAKDVLGSVLEGSGINEGVYASSWLPYLRSLERSVAGSPEADTVLGRAVQRGKELAAKVPSIGATHGIAGSALTRAQGTREGQVQWLEFNREPIIKSLTSSLETMHPAQRELALKWFTGDYKYDEGAKAMAESFIGPENMVPVRAARMLIDSYSSEAIRRGVAKDKIAEVIDSRLGEYLGQFYRIHYEHGLGKNMLSAYDNAKDTGRFSSILAAKEKGAKLSEADEHAYRVLNAVKYYEDPKTGAVALGTQNASPSVRHVAAESYVKNLVAERDPALRRDTFSGKKSVGYGNEADRLRARKEIPEAVKQLYYASDDLGHRVLHTVEHLSQLIENHRMLAQVKNARREDGTRYWYENAAEAAKETGAKESSFVKIPGDQDSPVPGAYGVLAGGVMPRDAFAAISDNVGAVGWINSTRKAFTNVPLAGPAMDWYDRQFKKSNTTRNPATHMRQLMGNLGQFAFYADASPANPANIPIYQEAIQGLLNPTRSPEVESFLKHQSMNRQLFADPEIRQRILDLSTKLSKGDGTATASFLEDAVKGTMTKARAADAFGANMYQASDQLVKLAAYIKRLRTNGGNEAEASRWVNLFTQDYSRVPLAIKAMEAIPGLSTPFLKFKYEQARIMANAAIHNPIKFAAYHGALAAIRAGLVGGAYGASQLFKDEQQRKDWVESQKLLPKYYRYGHNVPIRGMDPKNPNRIDLVNLDNILPDAGALALANQALDPNSSDVSKNFVGGAPLAAFAATAGWGFDPNSGKLPEDMGLGGRTLQAVKNAAKAAIPPLAPGGYEYARLARSGVLPSDLSGTLSIAPDRLGGTQDPVFALTAATTGIRPITFDAGSQLRNMAEEQRSIVDSYISRANKTIQAEQVRMETATTPEARALAQKNINEAARKLKETVEKSDARLAEIYKAYQAAKRTGWPESPKAQQAGAASFKGAKGAVERARKISRLEAPAPDAAE